MDTIQESTAGGGGGGGGGGEKWCQILRLPLEIISVVIGKTSPRDAARCAAVAPAFRIAADSDVAWSCFIPPDIGSIVSRAADPPAPPPTKKQFFLSLCDHPLLLDAGTVSFRLDRASGKKVWMLSARALTITWSSTPQYWKWIPHPDSRFHECAELVMVCWLEILRTISSNLLSSNSDYSAYLVYKLADSIYDGFVDNPLKASVSVEDSQVSGHRVQIKPWVMENPSGRRFPIGQGRRLGLLSDSGEAEQASQGSRRFVHPQARPDGWMEVKMGEMYIDGGGKDDKYTMRLMEIERGNWKSGLTVEGIEIRPTAES